MYVQKDIPFTFLINFNNYTYYIICDLEIIDECFRCEKIRISREFKFNRNFFQDNLLPGHLAKEVIYLLSFETFSFKIFWLFQFMCFVCLSISYIPVQQESLLHSAFQSRNLVNEKCSLPINKIA